jgi:hypothetical protein
MAMRNRKGLLKIFGVLAIGTLILSSCYKEDPLGAVASCEGCHTNYAHLQEVYSPDTAAAVGGCGGDAPHYEPYDRVFLDGSGWEEYKTSGHYAIGCVGCHGGVDGTASKQQAHSGNFMRHPSDDYANKCGTCHKDIADDFVTSLHNGTGQMRKVTMRNGLAGAHEFEMLSEKHKEGYNANCKTCHGTCGNCHVVRPKIAGGGLKKGHNFIKEPDMLTVCIACHTSRGGHAYLGVSPGTEPDVHLDKQGFTCMNCHEGHELHGDGEPVDQRYAYTELPSCDDCHAGLDNDNMYHTVHYGDFNCQVCHSQDYNNCGSCHIHGEGARVPSYMDFKIALNPIPDVKDGFKFTLVRRSLAAPDSWKEYGVEDAASFDVFPTYNYTTPHNIQRWTSRTQGGSTCSANCHAKNVDGVIQNKNLFLFEENLLDWEKGATTKITVDGKLPASWGI